MLIFIDMGYADAYKPQRYIIGAPELPRP